MVADIGHRRQYEFIVCGVDLFPGEIFISKFDEETSDIRYIKAYEVRRGTCDRPVIVQTLNILSVGNRRKYPVAGCDGIEPVHKLLVCGRFRTSQRDPVIGLIKFSVSCP